MTKKIIIILVTFSIFNVQAQTEKLTKMEYYQKYIAKSNASRSAQKAASAQDRKTVEAFLIKEMLFLGYKIPVSMDMTPGD